LEDLLRRPHENGKNAELGIFSVSCADPEIIQMVFKGKKTASDAARLFGVHPSTVCRLLAGSPLIPE
jgi:hypothetical protein